MIVKVVLRHPDFVAPRRVGLSRHVSGKAADGTPLTEARFVETEGTKGSSLALQF